MNLLQKAVLGAIGGLPTEVKRVGNQVPLVESYRDGLPIIQPYSVLAALEQEMRRNPFLYAALRKKADAIASIPFYVEKLEDGQWVRVVNHEAEHLIEGANPFMSGYELKRLMVYHKELTGSFYAQIVSVAGTPVFLQPLFPQFMRPVPSETNYLEGYEYTINGVVERKLKPAEVFWTKYVDPSDPYKGLSPLQSISGEIQTDLEARRWNMISLSNRGSSDVAFIMRNVTTEEDYQLARTMIEDRMSGPDNARRPWILGGDSDVRPLSYTAIEMDYINTRKFNREVISAAIGVPAPLIGASDNSTYNNLDTLRRDFWQDSITNFLEEIRQDLTRQILVPYYGDGRRTKAPAMRYMYDLSNVTALQTDLQVKADIAKTLRETGFSLRDIGQLLELGIMVEDEQEETYVEQEVDEDVVSDMARVAAGSVDDDQLFTRSIESIHRVVSAAMGVPFSANKAVQRANEYLVASKALDKVALAAVISRGEVLACRR